MDEQANLEILELARQGRLLDAIEKFQALHDVSVDDAERAVTAMLHASASSGGGGVTIIGDLPPGWSPALATQIDALMRANKKLEAIKVLREATGLGLKESKEAVEERAQSVGIKMSAGCFIATAAFADHDHDIVLALRRFRDLRLARTSHGRAFIRAYYTYSPRLADHIARSPTTRALCRALLRPLAYFLDPR